MPCGGLCLLSFPKSVVGNPDYKGLDSDLAELYEAAAGNLNKAVAQSVASNLYKLMQKA